MRRTNGKGTAVFVGSNRANCWVARITIGQDELGRQVRHNLGSFATKLDALIFLEQYHKNPTPIYISEKKYNKIVYFANTVYPLIPVSNPKAERQKYIQKDNMTFEKVFEGFRAKKIMTPEEMKLAKEKNIKVKGKFSAGYSKDLLNAYKYTNNLRKMIYKELKTSELQALINEINSVNKGSATTNTLIKLLRNLDKYAMQEGIITQGYSQFINNDTGTTNKVTKKVFTHKQIQKLEKLKINKKEQLVKDILIILLYTGFRINELIYLSTKNINLDKNYLIGGSKTEAGTNREIPVHPKIKSIIKKYYNEKQEFLFQYSDKPLQYGYINALFYSFRKKYTFLNNHCFHECRHTFRTELEQLGIKQVIINAILGHKNGNISLDTYTHITLQEKQMAVNMINYSEENKLVVLKTS